MEWSGPHRVRMHPHCCWQRKKREKSTQNETFFSVESKCIFHEWMSKTMLISQPMWNRFKCLMQTHWRRASIAWNHLDMHKLILPHVNIHSLFSYSFIEWEGESKGANGKFPTKICINFVSCVTHLCAIHSIRFDAMPIVVQYSFFHWAR